MALLIVLSKISSQRISMALLEKQIEQYKFELQVTLDIGKAWDKCHYTHNQVV